MYIERVFARIALIDTVEDEREYKLVQRAFRAAAVRITFPPRFDVSAMYA